MKLDVDGDGSDEDDQGLDEGEGLVLDIGDKYDDDDDYEEVGEDDEDDADHAPALPLLLLFTTEVGGERLHGRGTHR